MPESHQVAHLAESLTSTPQTLNTVLELKTLCVRPSHHGGTDPVTPQMSCPGTYMMVLFIYYLSCFILTGIMGMMVTMLQQNTSMFGSL